MSTSQTLAVASSQTLMSGSARTNQRIALGPLPPHRKPAPTDAQIIERLKNGDQAALQTIFGLYAAKLYRVARRILGEAADSEEVIQDVFWIVYRKAYTFKGKSRLSTWLYRLTVNAALDRIRRKKRLREVEYLEYLPKFHKDGRHRARPIIDWSDTLEEKYTAQEINSLIGKALDQLRPIDRSVVVLSDMEALADKKIAAALELTVTAVKARLHRARLFLRGKLAGLRRRRPEVRMGHELNITATTDST